MSLKTIIEKYEMPTGGITIRDFASLSKYAYEHS